MKKVLCFVFIMLIVVLIVFVALYSNPIIEYTVKPVIVGSDDCCELATIMYKTRLGLPLSPKKRDRIDYFNERQQLLYKDVIDNYESPRSIELEVTENKHSTEFLFTGKVTKNGEIQDYCSGFKIDLKMKEAQN